MPDFRVRYEIDVDADNPGDAALKANSLMKDHYYLPVLEVQQNLGDGAQPAPRHLVTLDYDDPLQDFIVVAVRPVEEMEERNEDR